MAVYTSSIPPPPLLPQTSSWEDMEYAGGLKLCGLPDGVIVRNTFIEYPATALRSPDDLDLEVLKEREWRSSPPTMDYAQQEGRGAAARAQGNGAAALKREEEPKPLASQDQCSQASTSIGRNRSISSSLEGSSSGGSINAWNSMKQQLLREDTAGSSSTTDGYDERRTSVCSSGEEEESPPVPQEKPAGQFLLEALFPHLTEPVFSEGSVPHQLGQPCRPCGFVHKPEGCSNGEKCQYCHLCPPGEIKQRKKVKQVVMKKMMYARRHHSYGGTRCFL